MEKKVATNSNSNSSQFSSSALNGNQNVIRGEEEDSHMESGSQCSQGDPNLAIENSDDHESQEEEGERPKGSRKVPWNGLEDSRLKSIIEGNSHVDVNGKLVITMSWGEVADLIPRRSAKQCRERWCYNLDPNIKQTAWSLEEDAILIKAQNQFHNQWALISRHLPGRTENAVKTRFKSIMRAKKREWTAEEDTKIFDLLRTHGSKWDLIKKQFPNRTANAIKTRFSQLKKGSCQNAENDQVGSARQIWYRTDLISSIPLDLLSTGRTSVTSAPSHEQLKLAFPSVDLSQQIHGDQLGTKRPKLDNMATNAFPFPLALGTTSIMNIALSSPTPDTNGTYSTGIMPSRDAGENAQVVLLDGFSKVNEGIVRDEILSLEEKATLLQQTQAVFSNYMTLKGNRVSFS